MHKKPDAIAKKLGADRTFPVKTHMAGPLSWMQLREEVHTRLHSRGGRPSDPRWEFRRQVPFQEQTWDLLNDLAKKLKHEGVTVEPAQIAAILVEHQIDTLRKTSRVTPRQPLQLLVKERLRPPKKHRAH